MQSGALDIGNKVNNYGIAVLLRHCSSGHLNANSSSKHCTAKLATSTAVFQDLLSTQLSAGQTYSSRTCAVC
jgi:hypothetical protein